MSHAGLSSRIVALLDRTPILMWSPPEVATADRTGDSKICDFMLGNPQEMPLQGVVEAFQKQIVPQDHAWYAYKMSEEASQKTVAKSLQKHTSLPYHPADVAMTNGAFAALAVTLSAITEPEDEIIFISPPWFFYEGMISNAGGKPIRVKVNPDTFELNLDAIKAVLGQNTRGIIINSPHNPTGKIYVPEQLTALAQLLTEQSERNGRPIYLLSDEAYSRIVYDGRAYHSPSSFYPNSFLIYTYGKTLLIPGQRLGYIALHPAMTNKEAVRNSLMAMQVFGGWAFPNALLQYSLEELEHLSINIVALQARRDKMVSMLTEIGYHTTSPEGTFYMMVRSPIADDMAFTDLLGKHGILCLPGTLLEMPGWIRLSLTASDETIGRSRTGFADAYHEASS